MTAAVDNDHKELTSTWMMTLAEAYKVLMACLLSVFVPQLCPETGNTCTLKENFSDLTAYNTFVLLFNFLTLTSFLYLYYLQNKREAYLISHLDADRNHTVVSFVTNLQEYPRIVKRVDEQNQELRKVTRFVMQMFSLNFLFSSILVLHFFYDGFRTVTTLLANILLVTSKLMNMHQVLDECTLSTPLALSTYRTAPVAYNVIDPNYKDGKYKVTSNVVEASVEAPPAAATEEPAEPPTEPTAAAVPDVELDVRAATTQVEEEASTAA